MRRLTAFTHSEEHSYLPLDLLAAQRSEGIRILSGLSFRCLWLGGYHESFYFDSDRSRAVHVQVSKRVSGRRVGAIVGDVRRGVALAVARGGEGALLNNEQAEIE